MPILEVRHITCYRYTRPVRFGEHRAMLRPRDSHDMTLRSTTLSVSPRATTRWVHDVFGNSITVLNFEQAAAELRVESRLELEHYPIERPDPTVARTAERWPFAYDTDLVVDLGHTLARHHPDPKGRVTDWARQFVSSGSLPTLDLLETMNRTIKETFTYAARETEGTQPPLTTLEKGTGSCRDYALLLMEGVRALGFAARFVSGYLYDPATDGGEPRVVGAGATHAWAQVFVPGMGWLELDPTNAIVGNRNLIRVAVARDPSQAVPLDGSWTGFASDFAGLTVEVNVRRRDPQGASAAYA